MAQYTKHPVSAPPSAPERESTGHLMLRAYSVLVLTVALAPAAVQNALGAYGTAAVALLLTAGTVAIGVPRLIRLRRETPFPWRRLPWTALGYVALALLSLSWSEWRATTLLTGILLLATTVQAVFLAVWLTWREILRSLASALKWVLGLSLAFELWVSLVVRHAILPNFVTPPQGEFDKQWYWSRDNLFDGGRIQGIVGNANLLGALALLGLIVFAIQIWASSRRQAWLVVWMLAAAFLLYRAGSATMLLCALCVAVVAVTVLVIRRASSPAARRNAYLVFIAVGLLGAVGGWLLREPALRLLGRSSNLTGREGIWEAVLEVANRRPVLGWGYASPWMPEDPAFGVRLIDHEMPVMQAHNMWVDAYLQLGIVGAILVGIAMLAFLWRSWFFAVDRPRWDLDENRPYSPVTVLPILVAALLLVQGFTESAPIMLWGWLLIVLFSFKIKSVPLVGVGLSERERVIDHGERRRRVP